MIQRIYEGYEDSKYYIDTNKKKLASDNMYVIGRMLAFFIAISVIFIASALAFGDGLTPYYDYIPSVFLLLIAYIIHKVIQKKANMKFESVRVYSLILYTIVILSFSIADSIIYSESRAVFFPAAILILSTLYVDTIGIIFVYKVFLSFIFILFEYNNKDSQLIGNDIVVAVLAILVSTFCYLAVIRALLSNKDYNEKLVKKGETDLLTGLLNKVSFEERCKDYLDARMIGAKVTMFIFDLDDFKHVNDNYGHQTGDAVLKIFAGLLQGYFHPDDIIGRVGGDEFMVLVLGDMPDGFVSIRCRNLIQELKTTKVDETVGISCSIGVVEDTQKKDFQELYELADKALYQAKKNGKSQWYLT